MALESMLMSQWMPRHIIIIAIVCKPDIHCTAYYLKRKMLQMSLNIGTFNHRRAVVLSQLRARSMQWRLKMYCWYPQVKSRSNMFTVNVNGFDMLITVEITFFFFFFFFWWGTHINCFRCFSDCRHLCFGITHTQLK